MKHISIALEGSIPEENALFIFRVCAPWGWLKWSRFVIMTLWRLSGYKLVIRSNEEGDQRDWSYVHFSWPFFSCLWLQICFIPPSYIPSCVASVSIINSICSNLWGQVGLIRTSTCRALGYNLLNLKYLQGTSMIIDGVCWVLEQPINQAMWCYMGKGLLDMEKKIWHPPLTSLNKVHMEVL